jgi:hypothetical protein
MVNVNHSECINGFPASNIHCVYKGNLIGQARKSKPLVWEAVCASMKTNYQANYIRKCMIYENMMMQIYIGMCRQIVETFNNILYNPRT